MKPSFTIDENGVVNGVYNFFVEGNILTPADAPDDILGMVWDGASFSDPFIDTAQIEKDWTMSELKRTDELSKLPDYPHKEKLFAYRQQLRDYDYGGERPVAPTTEKGTAI